MASTPLSRLLAGLEVLLVFGPVAACFRWMTGLDFLKLPGTFLAGYHFWPYLALWLFTPIFLLMARRDLANYGIIARRIRYHLNIAAACFIPFFILSVALTWITWKQWVGAALIALIEAMLLVATAWFLRKYPDRNVPLLLAAGLLIAPLAAGQVGKAMASLAVTYLLVAPAEEMFFRGYAQSRLNQALGRPYCTLGVRWGWGLVSSALLFGLWHLAAVPQPVLPHALWTVFMGLMLGVVREKSGSVFAPGLLHGVVNYGPQAFLYALFF